MPQPKPITVEYIEPEDYTGYTPQPFAIIGTPPSGGSVDSVNGQTGAVVLDASDVEALPDTYVPAWGDVTGVPAALTAAQAAGTASIRAIGTTATTAAAGNHTHTFASLAGTVSGATGATLQAILEDLATRVTALEP